MVHATLHLLLLLLVPAPSAAQVVIQTVKKVKCKGPPVEFGDTIWFVHVGRLQSGARMIFDESGEVPLKIRTLGMGTQRLIAGMEYGMKGMCVGEKRRLVIPPDYAYDDRTRIPAGRSPVPPKSTVVYEIELVDHIPRNLKQKQPQVIPEGAIVKEKSPGGGGKGKGAGGNEDADEDEDEGDWDENFDEL